MYRFIIQVFLVNFVLLSVACSPRSGGRKSSGTVNRSSSNFSNLLNNASENKNSNGEDAEFTDSILDEDSLEAMDIDEIRANYRSRQNELDASKFDFAINDQIGNALCLRLEQLKKECTVADQLIPSQSRSSLRCTQEQEELGRDDGVGSKVFSVNITNAEGVPFSSVDGEFILVVNTNYYSSPFGASKEPLEFTYKGGGNVEPPQIKEIFEIELRRADEDTNAIFNGGGRKMPSKDDFYIKLSYGDIVLTDGRLLDVNNTALKGYRYRADLAFIFGFASSNRCRVKQEEIDEIKKQIRESLNSQAEYKQKSTNLEASLSSMLEDELKQGVIQLQDEILAIEEALEASLDRIFKLTNELKAVQSIGCHSEEPIIQITIELLGKENDPKLLGDVWDKCPVIEPSGPGNIFDIKMGSSLVFPIDQEQYGIGGGPWTQAPSDQVLVSDVQYFKISKQGITIEDSGRVCLPGVGGIGESCGQTCTESHIYALTGARVRIETPSGSFLIYENLSVNKVFASREYSPTAIVTWDDGSLRAREPWLNLMYDTNCEVTQ